MAVGIGVIAFAVATAGAGEAAPVPSGASAVASPTPTSTPAPTAAIDVPIQSGALAAVAATVPPVRLRIDSLGVDMPVTDVGIDAEALMELPENPATAGWYRYGPDAAVTEGHAVISAHVDSPIYGIGPLSNLRDAGVGSAVTVDTADGGTRSFVIESVTFYEKVSLPIDELFSREGEPALVIITCGGPFDNSTGHYRDNVVAIARPQ